LFAISANDDRNDSSFPCHNLISSESKPGLYWRSGTSAVDHFVKIDFKDLRICPSAYSLKGQQTAWGNMWSWRFEGSNDDSEWALLDNRINCEDLSRGEASFQFSAPPSTAFRFIRFVMVGSNSGGSRQLLLQRFEVFGRLIAKVAKPPY
jgi:hypothetical protein